MCKYCSEFEKVPVHRNVWQNAIVHCVGCWVLHVLCCSLFLVPCSLCARRPRSRTLASCTLVARVQVLVRTKWRVNGVLRRQWQGDELDEWTFVIKGQRKRGGGGRRKEE